MQTLSTPALSDWHDVPLPATAPRTRPMRRSRLLPALATLLLLAPAAAAAQVRDRASDAEWCDRGNGWNDGERRSHCEVRELTLDARSLLRVDGRANGGVRVEGWDGSDIRVRARVQANAETEAEAREIARLVRIADDDVLRAEGPTRLGRREGWSVSYEIMVPRRTDLEIDATNGGIGVRGVAGRMQLETRNGGLRLADVAGDVRGRTRNGGVVAELDGARWEGAGLDLETTNGGVRLVLPADYSATLETATVNGGMTVDFPVMVQGRIGRELRAELGRGGPTIRARTTNGGVRVERR